MFPASHHRPDFLPRRTPRALGPSQAVPRACAGPRDPRDRCAAVSAVLAALLAIGAGFNGASFLDFGGQNISSLIMALLALGALCCYLLAVYMLPRRG